jgi:hypothetical protein
VYYPLVTSYLFTAEPSPAPNGDEDGEPMDAESQDDAAMMAMMGMSGFGSTKVGSLSVP